MFWEQQYADIFHARFENVIKEWECKAHLEMGGKKKTIIGENAFGLSIPALKTNRILSFLSQMYMKDRQTKQTTRQTDKKDS